METPMIVALAGNPNSGKTTIFNELTGSRQHIGNYPGVTVEKKEGIYRHDGKDMSVVDLPGTYSLTAYSLEEQVARDFISKDKPHAVVHIVDASNIERNLYLTVQFLEMGQNVIVALNMMDIAKSRGISIDTQKLSELLGIPVVETIGRQGRGIEEMMRTASHSVNSGCDLLSISYGDDIDNALNELTAIIEAASFLTDRHPARWTALKYVESDEQIMREGSLADIGISSRLEGITGNLEKHLRATLKTYPEAMIADYRYGYIRSIVRQTVKEESGLDRLHLSDRIDMVLVNRYIGPLIMLCIIFLLYKFTFSLSRFPVEYLDRLFTYAAGFASTHMPDNLLRSLVVSGVIEGVGGVIKFIPLIMFMFFGIAILEDSGYLARTAFMLDRIFRMFGMHGSSVMSYIISGGIAGGCAVPGVMAARTIKSPKERLATILTTPFMSCGAKLPVYALLVGAFFSKGAATVMILITFISWAGALLVALLLRSTVLKGDSTPFVMELPPYRLPTLKGLFIHTWERSWQYLKKAGTIILAISIMLWALMTFPMLPKEMRFDNETARAEAALMNSAAGRLGRTLEGISSYAGFDWRINIALIGGFAAKEVIVSTLGTAYSLGIQNHENTIPLSNKLASRQGFSSLTALSLIIFVIFYSPCFATVVCIARESGSWKWGAFVVVFSTLIAFLFATSVYQTGRLLGF